MIILSEWRFLFVAIVVIASAALHTPEIANAQDQEFFFVTNDGTYANNLYRMELGSSAPTHIGQVAYGGILSTLDRGRYGTAYTIHRETDTLYEISLTDASIVSTRISQIEIPFCV